MTATYELTIWTNAGWLSAAIIVLVLYSTGFVVGVTIFLWINRYRDAALDPDESFRASHGPLYDHLKDGFRWFSSLSQLRRVRIAA